VSVRLHVLPSVFFIRLMLMPMSSPINLITHAKTVNRRAHAKRKIRAEKLGGGKMVKVQVK